MDHLAIQVTCSVVPVMCPFDTTDCKMVLNIFQKRGSVSDYLIEGSIVDMSCISIGVRRESSSGFDDGFFNVGHDRG